MNNEFQREERYVVFKISKLDSDAFVKAKQLEVLNNSFLEDARVECVVVEADWPEYERVWTMIEARVTGKVSAVDTPEVLAVVSVTESAFPETMVIHRDAIDAVPVGTELIDRAHFTRLQAEISALRGLTPGLPPRPPEGQGLPRYGLRWNGPSQPLAVPMEDGYWTPWHLADQFRTKKADVQAEGITRRAGEKQQ